MVATVASSPSTMTVTSLQCDISTVPVMILHFTTTVHWDSCRKFNLMRPRCTVGAGISSAFSASSAYDFGCNVAFAGVAHSKFDKSCVSTIRPGPLVSHISMTRLPAPSESRVTYLTSCGASSAFPASLEAPNSPERL